VQLPGAQWAEAESGQPIREVPEWLVGAALWGMVEGPVPAEELGRVKVPERVLVLEEVLAPEWGLALVRETGLARASGLALVRLQVQVRGQVQVPGPVLDRLPVLVRGTVLALVRELVQVPEPGQALVQYRVSVREKGLALDRERTLVQKPALVLVWEQGPTHSLPVDQRPVPVLQPWLALPAALVLVQTWVAVEPQRAAPAERLRPYVAWSSMLWNYGAAQWH
ncbi:MAG: hypothetical protein RLZZ458_1106, partial [Planctomycetota bacterium]